MQIGKMYDMVLGYAGVMLTYLTSSFTSEDVKYWVPWFLGVALTCFAIINQYQQYRNNKLLTKKIKSRHDRSTK